MIRNSGAVWLLVAVMLLYIGLLAHNGDKGVLTWEPWEPVSPISGLLGTPIG